MEFCAGGSVIHDAPWEPTWAFGQGSLYHSDASHGGVHLPDAAMRFLHGGTPSGTPVTVA